MVGPSHSSRLPRAALLHLLRLRESWRRLPPRSREDYGPASDSPMSADPVEVAARAKGSNGTYSRLRPRRLVGARVGWGLPLVVGSGSVRRPSFGRQRTPPPAADHYPGRKMRDVPLAPLVLMGLPSGALPVRTRGPWERPQNPVGPRGRCLNDAEGRATAPTRQSIRLEDRPTALALCEKALVSEGAREIRRKSSHVHLVLLAHGRPALTDAP